MLDNKLFIRIKRNDKTSELEYALHDAETKERLIKYNSFENLVDTEIYQQNVEL